MDETSTPIPPVRISHHVEGVDPADFADDPWNAQVYNSLDYHFVRAGLEARGRAYLDEICKVFVHGPDPGEGSVADAAALLRDVVAYFRPRFQTVLVLDARTRAYRPA